MEEIFKKLVDSTQPTLKANDTGDLHYLYAHYQIPYTNSLTLSEIYQYLSKKIKDNLTGDQIYISQLNNLKNQLLLNYFIKQEKPQPYLGILQIIINSLGEKDSPSDEPIRRIINCECNNKWQATLQFAWDITVIHPQKIDNNQEELSREYGRQFVVSRSAKFLQIQGCKIDIQDGKFLIKESQAKNIAQHIEKDIKSLGGLETIKEIFKLINNKYNQKQSRYHLGRRLSAAPQIYQPSLPIGYLINLAVKFSQSNTINHLNTSKKQQGKLWQNILQKSTALASILDVEPYTYFSLIFNGVDKIVKFTQELALYDNLFCPIQLRPSDTSKIILGLLSDFDQEIKQKLEWTSENAAKIADRIFEIADSTLYPVIFNTQQIYNSIPELDRKLIDKVLDVYSHKAASVNPNFQTPEDISKVPYDNYFYHKPFIKLDKGKYLLVNSSICAPAFYEAITAEIRNKVDSNINDKLGIKIEDFIKNELDNKNIKFKHGDYKSTDDEIDIVVETSDSLIFFEIKAKPLTRRSRCGNDLNLFLDLSKSLLASQIQTNKHEISLRKNNFIQLENGCVYWKNREIAKVSITLLDFGGFQDRTFIFQFLQCMLRGQLESNNNINEENIKQINKKIDQFQQQFKELIELDAEKANNPFYDCWFLSLPQLLIILDNVNSSDDLKRELWITRSMSTSSMDFYQEYEYARQLQLNSK